MRFPEEAADALQFIRRTVPRTTRREYAERTRTVPAVVTAMTAPAADPSRRWVAFAVALFLLGLAWTAADIALDRQPKLRHRATLDSAYFAFALWVGAVALLLRAPAGEWAGPTGAVRVARWCWALGAVTFWVHVAVAFHFAHGWSHANGIRHVEDTSGFGPGLFVSYFFTLLWAIDAGWWVLTPASYAARPNWLGVAIHSFMAFIVLNGTVVFGHPPMREVSAGVFAVLGVVLVRRSVG